MLDSQLELTAQAFQLYRDLATQYGFTAGPQHLGYMLKVHVDETEEKAYETGRKLIEGPGNLFLDGSNGQANPWAQALPGLNARKPEDLLPTADYYAVRQSRGLNTRGGLRYPEAYSKPASTPEEHEKRRYEIWDSVLARKAAIVGTPETVIPSCVRSSRSFGRAASSCGPATATSPTKRPCAACACSVKKCSRPSATSAPSLELTGPWERDPRRQVLGPPPAWRADRGPPRRKGGPGHRSSQRPRCRHQPAIRGRGRLGGAERRARRPR